MGPHQRQHDDPRVTAEGSRLSAREAPTEASLSQPTALESSRAARTRGLNIQFGMLPPSSEASSESPRLEGNEWDVIDERVRLMAQLHSLQAEIALLARRNNERIGVPTNASTNTSLTPPIPEAAGSFARRRSSGGPESAGSTSFSSNDTLFEDEAGWPDLAAGSDAFDDGKHHLVMNAADLQKLRQYKGVAAKHEGALSVAAALQQVLKDSVELGRALHFWAGRHSGVIGVVLLALLAISLKSPLVDMINR